MTDIEALARVLAHSRRGVTAKVNVNDLAQAEAALGWMQKTFSLAALRGYVVLVQNLEGDGAWEAAYTGLLPDQAEAEAVLHRYVDDPDVNAEAVFCLGHVREIETRSLARETAS